MRNGMQSGITSGLKRLNAQIPAFGAARWMNSASLPLIRIGTLPGSVEAGAREHTSLHADWCYCTYETVGRADGLIARAHDESLTEATFLRETKSRTGP